MLSLIEFVTAGAAGVGTFVGVLNLYYQRKDKHEGVRLKAYPSLSTLRDLRKANIHDQLRVIPGYRLVAINTSDEGSVLEDIRFKPFISFVRHRHQDTLIEVPPHSRTERESTMPRELLFYQSSRMALALGWFTARDLFDHRCRTGLRLMIWRHLDQYSEGFRRTGHILRVSPHLLGKRAKLNRNSSAAASDTGASAAS
jgi:hypothetical protein